MATLAELRDAVLRALDRKDAPDEEVAEATNWINEAIREVICLRHQWPAMEAIYTRNTIANQDSYSIPNSDNNDDVLHLLMKVNTSDYMPLEEVTSNQARFQFLETTNVGEPRAWFEWAGAIFLRPIPNVSTYSMLVLVTEMPGNLTDDGNTNWWTNQMPHVVKAWARAYGYEFYKEWDLAQAARGVAEAELAQAISADKRSKSPARQIAVPSLASGIPMANRRGWRRDDTGPYRMYSNP